MSLLGKEAKLYSLKDKHYGALTNEEIKKQTEELKKDTKKVKSRSNQKAK